MKKTDYYNCPEPKGEESKLIKWPNYDNSNWNDQFYINKVKELAQAINKSKSK